MEPGNMSHEELMSCLRKHIKDKMDNGEIPDEKLVNLLTEMVKLDQEKEKTKQEEEKTKQVRMNCLENINAAAQKTDRLLAGKIDGGGPEQYKQLMIPSVSAAQADEVEARAQKTAAAVEVGAGLLAGKLNLGSEGFMSCLRNRIMEIIEKMAAGEELRELDLRLLPEIQKTTPALHRQLTVAAASARKKYSVDREGNEAGHSESDSGEESVGSTQDDENSASD